MPHYQLRLGFGMRAAALPFELPTVLWCSVSPEVPTVLVDELARVVTELETLASAS